MLGRTCLVPKADKSGAVYHARLPWFASIIGLNVALNPSPGEGSVADKPHMYILIYQPVSIVATLQVLANEPGSTALLFDWFEISSLFFYWFVNNFSPF